MKKLILTMFFCLTAATAFANSQDGYRLTQEMVASYKSGCDYTTKYLKDLTRGLRGKDVYDQRVRTQVIEGRLPGAKINLAGGGTLDLGNRIQYIDNFACYAVDINTNLVQEKYDFRNQVYSITGPGGTAAASFAGKRPVIIQATLPDMAETASEMLGVSNGEVKGYSTKQNATIELLQLAYDEDYSWAFDGNQANAIQQVLFSAVTSTEDRRAIFDIAAQHLKNRPAKTVQGEVPANNQQNAEPADQQAQSQSRPTEQQDQQAQSQGQPTELAAQQNAPITPGIEDGRVSMEEHLKWINYQENQKAEREQAEKAEAAGGGKLAFTWFLLKKVFGLLVKTN